MCGVRAIGCVNGPGMSMPLRSGIKGRVAGNCSAAAGAVGRHRVGVRVIMTAMMIAVPVVDRATDRAVRRGMRARVSADPAAGTAETGQAKKNRPRREGVAADFLWNGQRPQVLSIKAEMAKETMPAVMQITASR